MNMQSIDDGETLHIRGYDVRVRIEYDADGGLPWKNCDGMGVIRETRDQRNKHAGERPFGSCYMFDVRATTIEAKRDCWGVGAEAEAELAKKLGRTPTAAQITAEAVERQYQYLRDWANDMWQYHGYVVTLMDGTEESGHEDSCWGFEYWLFDDEKNAYFYDEIRGAAEALVREAEKEATERRYWESRDVCTEVAA